MFRKLMLKDCTRDAAVAAVYLIFLAAVVYAFAKDPTPASVPAYAVLLLFWAFGVLDEALRRSYRSAYQLLMESCDPIGAMAQLDVLDRRDLLKGYRVRSALLRGLALIDSGRVKDARELLLAHAKPISRSADSRFALCYLMFWCDLLDRDLGKLKETYQALAQFYEAGGSGRARRQGLLPTSRKVLAGCYFLANRRYAEAEEQFAAVPQGDLANRDKVWYAVFRSRLARHGKDAAAEGRWLAQAEALAPRYPCVLEHRPIETAGEGNAP
ncbi:exported hypothetical protein [uncultured Eubacteriales bacterium]|uniref:Tetratricopeptide repeat protein n=1 Tax=uncultured Eubacteriales bacterium TaxID=172733 RepID=A0A212IYU8_9FIRM|nr:exported hypothetical protein [uncultured Eubacteriales bacterium]